MTDDGSAGAAGSTDPAAPANCLIQLNSANQHTHGYRSSSFACSREHPRVTTNGELDIRPSKKRMNPWVINTEKGRRIGKHRNGYPIDDAVDEQSQMYVVRPANGTAALGTLRHYSLAWFIGTRATRCRRRGQKIAGKTTKHNVEK